MLNRRRLIATGLPIGPALAVPGMAPAQEYPKAPVRMIVPFPSGNVTDLATRIIGAQLPTTLGKPFVVEKLTKDAGIEPE
jgi:tripartite-type tricarboxylate transporter receptor subunit TctC